MTDKSFDIKVLDLHWITNDDDPADLCAHGYVYIKIGNKVISDKDSGYWTLSSTALYLMRTITDDYQAGDFGSQIVPCCGHFMVVDEMTNKVQIFGCPYGIDWKIVHDGKKVKHIADDGHEGTLEIDEYKKIVFEFADKVEQFYRDSSPKTIPDDEFYRNAYLAFWKEWRELRAS